MWYMDFLAIGWIGVVMAPSIGSCEVLAKERKSLKDLKIRFVTGQVA